MILHAAPLHHALVPTGEVGRLLTLALGVAVVVILLVVLGSAIASMAPFPATGVGPQPTAAPQAAPVPPPVSAGGPRG